MEFRRAVSWMVQSHQLGISGLGSTHTSLRCFCADLCGFVPDWRLYGS